MIIIKNQAKMFERRKVVNARFSAVDEEEDEVPKGRWRSRFRRSILVFLLEL